MSQRPGDLKSMPLYRDVDRIYNELREAGLAHNEAVSASDLAAFDQYHYHGTEAVDAAIAALDINQSCRVLEIGSGIGGPARHIATSTGANVIALELQADLNATAAALTRRCGLSSQVEHFAGDVLTYTPEHDHFDAIVSWLAFFHIEQRQQLLTCCKSWLKSGAGIFVEDLYARGKFTKEEQDDLDVILYSRYLPSRSGYEDDLRTAGFADIQTTDMSDDWRQFTHDRYADFCRDRARHDRVHGQEIVEGLDSFYATVARLFANGNLGGIRLIARNA